MLRNDSLKEYKANPTVKILKESHSFDDIDKVATAYSKEKHSKQVHISYDFTSFTFFAWIKE